MKIKERAIIKENTNWWQRAVAVAGFIFGIDILAAAQTLSEVAAGTGIILASVWLWGESKKQTFVVA